MPSTVAPAPAQAQRVIPEIDRRAVKADLRIPEKRDFRAAVGRCIERMMQLAGLNLEQLSALLDRDPRQVRRWMDGTERPLFDVLFEQEALQQPLVIALCELAGHGVEIETVVRVRRVA